MWFLRSVAARALMRARPVVRSRGVRANRIGIAESGREIKVARAQRRLVGGPASCVSGLRLGRVWPWRAETAVPEGGWNGKRAGRVSFPARAVSGDARAGRAADRRRVGVVRPVAVFG